MSVLTPVDLGAERTAVFVYEEGAAIPFSIIVTHRDHKSRVRWVRKSPEHRVFTLESLCPLTIAEPMQCSCGEVGLIRGNVWWRKDA